MANMAEWIEPHDGRQWLQRIFALQPVLVVLMLGALLVAELRFDWIERFVGAYLVSTNNLRPESGTIWEKGHKTLTARATLDKIVTDRQAAQQEVRNAASITQLARSLGPGQGIILAPDHFRQLYLRLPETVSQQTISAFDLLRLSAGGRWHRTYVERSAGGLELYMLDAGNRVLRQASIGQAVLDQLDSSAAPTPGRLEDQPDFQERIYPADRFFDALEEFPDEVRLSILPHPERLLAAGGQVRRVGISDETGAGFIALGFEIADGAALRVLRVKGSEWAVWRLRGRLEGRAEPASKDRTKEIGAPL